MTKTTIVRDVCAACGQLRAVLRLREILGAEPNEDVFVVARARMAELAGLRVLLEAREVDHPESPD